REHDARLQLSTGTKYDFQPYGLLHPDCPEVNSGVQFGEVQQCEAVESEREGRELERAAGEVRQTGRAPDAVGGERGAGAGVRIGSAGEEAAAGQRRAWSRERFVLALRSAPRAEQYCS